MLHLSINIRAKDRWLKKLDFENDITLLKSLHLAINYFRYQDRE